MLNASDDTLMEDSLGAVLSDNPVDIVIRRGATTLAAQTVRIARAGSGGRRENIVTSQVQGSVVVLGDLDFDVQVGDRFTDSIGQVFEIKFVRPNRTVAVTAEATIIQ